MHSERVVPVLQSVASMRAWVGEHIPLARSLLGYDLFIKLGSDLCADGPLDVDSFAAGLANPREQVLEHLASMQEAGLLLVAPGIDGRQVIHPTGQFVGLLEEYTERFERLFIVREGLRSRQLLVSSSDPGLARLAEVLYDRMHDLGWLYLHNFGAACFLMAMLVRRVALAQGHAARVASCHVELAHAQGRFLLGARGYAKPGQVDGHAVCVVDESVVIDFGLGNVRRGYRRDFAWGVACDYQRDGAVLARLALPGERVTWKDDWQTPHTQRELDRYAAAIEPLYQQYAARFG
jgi:hypothetical protein